MKMSGCAFRYKLSFAACCLLTLASAPSARAEAQLTPAPAVRPTTHDWSGVWLPSGGPIFDPSYRNRPENKGYNNSESRIFPPYNAEYDAKYSKVVANNRKGVSSIDPAAACRPPGMPRIMAANFPLEFIIQPKRVIIFFELDSQRRIIYTDGRKHTPVDELDPSLNGESIGHWEDEILVVDTIGLRSEPVFDMTGATHSDALHVVERIRRLDETRIEDRMTLEDPKAFTRPWEITRTMQLKPRLELMDYYCDEGNRFLLGTAAASHQ